MSAKAVEPFYREMGARLRRLRTDRGLTQDWVGKAVKPAITRAAVANIEVGKQRVLAHRVAELARVLDVQVSDIFPTPAAAAKVPAPMISIRDSLRGSSLIDWGNLSTDLKVFLTPSGAVRSKTKK